MKALKISQVTKKDFAEWVDLGVEFWFKWKKEDIKKEFKKILTSKNETSFICRDDKGLAVGFINVAIRTDYVEGSKTHLVGYLEGVYVKKAFRNRGIATLLFKEAKKWFAVKKVKEIGSDVEIHNKKSQRFHAKLGFKRGETLVHYLKKL